MATTGELRAIIEGLQLIDIGDATSYLGEERAAAEESLTADPQQEDLPGVDTESPTLSCQESSFK